MTSYKLIKCLLSTSFFHEESLVISKFKRLQGSLNLYAQSLNLQIRDISFFILNFSAAFKGNGLHIARNEFLTQEILSFCKCLKYMFNGSTKSQPFHVIMVEQLIKKPVLFLWLEGANFHWVVGYIYV